MGRRASSFSLHPHTYKYLQFIGYNSPVGVAGPRYRLGPRPSASRSSVLGFSTAFPYPGLLLRYLHLFRAPLKREQPLAIQTKAVEGHIRAQQPIWMLTFFCPLARARGSGELPLKGKGVTLLGFSVQEAGEKSRCIGNGPSICTTTSTFSACPESFQASRDFLQPHELGLFLGILIVSQELEQLPPISSPHPQLLPKGVGSLLAKGQVESP